MILWAQWTIAVAGLIISLSTLREAVLNYQLVRRLGVNSVYRVMTTGGLLDELSHVGLQVCILIPATLLLSRGQRYQLTLNVWLFIAMSVLTTFASVNAVVVRRRTHRAFDDRPRP